MKKVFQVIVTILAFLGVVFLILLFLPDDEEESAESAETQVPAVTQQVEQPVATQAAEPAEEEATVTEAPAAEVPVAEAPAEQVQETPAEEQETAAAEPEAAEESSENTVEVVIPASEITDEVLKFRTTTLDEKPVSQDIFADYDLTVLHVWGTYCQPCIAEMGDYAKLYDELPDNVNLVGLINDVYDGIESNVKTANKILDGNDAKFMNLRASDDLYDEVIEKVNTIPAVLFVDGEGHIVGEIMNGVRFSTMKKRLDGYLK